MLPFLCIILVGLIASGASEALQWYLLHRTGTLSSVAAAARSIQSKLSKTKVITKTKRVQRLKAELKHLSQKQVALQFRATIATSLCMLGMFYWINRTFTGVPVATLPFEPFFLARALAYRGLSEADIEHRQSSAIFVYVLSTMVLRGAIQKITGFGTDSAESMKLYKELLEEQANGT